MASYTATIGGQTVLVEGGTLRITRSVGRRSQASFTVQTDAYTFFAQYQQVSIKDGSGVVVFTGYITQPSTQKPGFSLYLEHTITCVDQHYLADKRVFFGSFTNRTVGVIVTAIFNQVLIQEGVTIGQIDDGVLPSPTTYPSPTLYPSGSGLVPQATFFYTNVAQALDQLAAWASISGIPYYWMIDHNKKFWFVKYTSIVNSTVVDGTLVEEQLYPPTVVHANPAYRNTQYVTGGVSQVGPLTESRQGDGKLTTWTMTFDLASAPTISVNGASKYVGIQGTGNSQYYWAQGSKVITQDSSQAKLASTDTLSVTYTGQFPSTAVQSNPSQIAAQAALDGSSGINEQVTDDQTIGNNALTEASALLNRNGNQGVQFKFSTMAAGYAPGQLITVDYGYLGFQNAKMLIESMDIEDKDGINIWYTITAVSGAFDTNWQTFFSRWLGYKVPANSINAGSKLVYAPPLPSPTTYPSPSLFPG